MSQPAEILADRWALVEKIDEGAMGEIFRATHTVLGHAVALKVLNPTVSRDKAATERFLREARIAARLQHRNIVRVEDFGVTRDGRPFLVMELLHGESLARRLARAPRPSHAETLDVIRQIAAGVDAAHAAGIVHRDLKPENVFLAQRDGATVVKVLDFGVAKFTDALANGARATASNTLIGTPRYMSPEQARSSRELDGRSDLWAVGMIAYEMLTGVHPLEGEAIAELLVAILTHRIAPPSSLRPELPDALDEWVEVALARSRYERFPTGRALADALADALDAPRGDNSRALRGDNSRALRDDNSRALRDDNSRALHDDNSRALRDDNSRALRGGTLRVPRGSVASVNTAALKQTPIEGPAPVTVPVRRDNTPLPRGIGAAAEEVSQPSPHARPRASWRTATLVAMIATVAIVLGARAWSPLASSSPHRLPSPAAPSPSTTQPATVTLPTIPSSARSTARAVPTPLPLEPMGPLASPVAGSLDPAAPVEASVEASVEARRRRRRHRRHHAPRGSSTVSRETPASGLYDPPGI